MNDIMTVSCVRRLHRIQRELDGIRVDSRAMVPRPEHAAIVEIYKAENALMRAADLLSPDLHRHYLRIIK